MSSVDQNDEFRTKLVKDALWGKFAVQMPFPILEWSKADVNEKLLAAETHLQRIHMMKRYFKAEEFLQILQSTDKYLQKDGIVAEMFMKKYEEYYSSSDYKMALRSLNLATLFATEKTIRRIYRKRSGLLFELGNWEECLQDTELVLRKKCPMSMMIKLKCEENLRACEKSQKPEVIAKHEYRNNILFQLYKLPNEKLPSASNIVEIRWDDKRGRGLFVKEDVEPGTALLIEDPYVMTLTEGLNWVIKYCWRCLKIILTTIPCQHCVFAVYCSVQCRSEDAIIGHAYECPCLSYFHGAFIGPNAHLSCKTILKAGPEELFKLFKSSTLEEIQKTQGINPKTGVYDSAAYLPLLALTCHIENDGLLPILVLTTISFIEILDAKTNFFAQVEESEKENFKDFVASVALFHNLSAPINCVGLEEEFDRSESIAIGRTNANPENEDICFLMGVYPLISLMNHACQSNVCRANLTNGKMVIMAVRGLRAGEEMLFGYGFDHATYDLKCRQESLLRIYSFHCQCAACKFDWPSSEVMKLDVNDQKLRCPDCTDKFGYDQSDQCALADLKDGSGECPACSKKFRLEALYEEIRGRASDLELSKQYLSDKNPVPAIRLVLEYIKLIQKRVCRPSYEMFAAQVILNMAYSKLTED